LYVKLPTPAVEKLDRVASALGLTKKELITTLVTKYVDPKDPTALRPTIGRYSFTTYDVPEVMSSSQAGQFLQIDERTVIEMAEAGELPGKKLGSSWRFSRDALVKWLSTPG
jgi:excisionase family DNA binding protein